MIIQNHQEIYSIIAEINQMIKFKSRFTISTGNDSAVNVEIAVLLKYFGNFRITLEMSLINYEICFIRIWSANCVICEADSGTSFAINDTNLHISAVTLPTQDNTKLLQQLKSGFKCTINWNQK